MMTIEEAREEARKLAAAGIEAVVYHAPEHRDDWDDDDHAYGYQPAAMAGRTIGETVVETYPAMREPAYKTATAADVLKAWQEAYGARTPIERAIIKECHERASVAGLSIGLVLMEAERFWQGAGRLTEPRKWRSRAAACRRMLDYAASR